MKSIILVGSSIFRAWTQATDLFPNYRIVNHAVDGTTTAYLTQNLTQVLTEESPDFILYYCGSNDLNSDVSQEDIIMNVRECRAIIRSLCPTAKLAYFGIIKAPQKAGKWEIIDRLNRDISMGLDSNDIYIDSNAVFFSNGAPITKWFIEDGLHLTVEAYDQLSDYSAPILRPWLE